MVLLFINCKNANLSPRVLNADMAIDCLVIPDWTSCLSLVLISLRGSFGLYVLSVLCLGPKSELGLGRKSALPH